MNNQTKCGETSPQATIFSAFGKPEKIFMDGENITEEIVKDFGGVDKWLLRLAAAFNDLRIKAFTLSRVGGVVKLYVRSCIRRRTMQTQKSIVEKLVIFDYPFCAVAYYAKYSDGGECYRGFSTIEHTKQFPVKAIYEGAAATRKLWEIEFDDLSDVDKKLIIAVFPSVLNTDKIPTKRPREILERATARVRFSFGVKCPRCGGEGRYPSKVDNGICHKCHGSGVVSPRLTDKKLAEIAKRFSEVEE